MIFDLKIHLKLYFFPIFYYLLPLDPIYMRYFLFLRGHKYDIQKFRNLFSINFLSLNSDGMLFDHTGFSRTIQMLSSTLAYIIANQNNFLSFVSSQMVLHKWESGSICDANDPSKIMHLPYFGFIMA